MAPSAKLAFANALAEIGWSTVNATTASLPASKPEATLEAARPPIAAYWYGSAVVRPPSAAPSVVSSALADDVLAPCASSSAPPLPSARLVAELTDGGRPGIAAAGPNGPAPTAVV